MTDAVAAGKAAKIIPAADSTQAELLSFERLLAELSARFTSVRSEQVVSEIETAQARVREFLGLERSTFGEFRDDGSLVVLSSTAATGIEPASKGPLPAQLAWFTGKLRDGEMMAFQTLPDDLPPEAVGEAEWCRRTGLRSQLSIPLRIGGHVVGVAAFSAFSETRSW